MRISIFLSYPKPFLAKQEEFLKKITNHFNERGLIPRTLGVTDYDMNTPLKAIRSVMLECNGLVTIGFKRTLIRDGIIKPSANTGNSEAKAISNAWLTSPWTHIEAAMAYQIGLPILVFRERGVIEDGMLEKGVVGIYMPDFDVDNAKNYFTSIEWRDVIGRWEGYVRSVADKKGNPPQLY